MASHEHGAMNHEHGNMNIETQERTFDSFVKIVGYSVVAILLLLIFLGLANG